MSTTIPAPIEHTWALFTDLEKHPQWSPWLDQVDYQSKGMCVCICVYVCVYVYVCGNTHNITIAVTII